MKTVPILLKTFRLTLITDQIDPSNTMYKLVLALALGVATAFTPAPVARSATRLAGAKDDLVDLAESNTDALGAAIGFWDPLGASNLDFWGLGEEGTIGYLRHAEIKHGESSTPRCFPLPRPFPSVIPRILSFFGGG